VIRIATALGVVCLVAAVGLVIIDSERNLIPIVVLFAFSFAIAVLLGVRRAILRAREIVGDARRFASGRVQTARLTKVGDPKGLINTRANVVLEFEGEDGAIHTIDRDMPVPFPVAWGYRLGKRFKLPLIRSINLAEMLAFELSREGMRVSVGRRRG
jgi:hypothetical protein